MRKCLQQRRQKHTEGVSAGPSDLKQDEKQAGDDEPCPTFMLSHCYLRQIVARRVRPSCSTCTGFRLCHPRSAFCPRPDPCTFPLRIRRPELAERCLRLWSYPTSAKGAAVTIPSPTVSFVVRIARHLSPFTCEEIILRNV